DADPNAANGLLELRVLDPQECEAGRDRRHEQHDSAGHNHGQIGIRRHVTKHSKGPGLSLSRSTSPRATAEWIWWARQRSHCSRSTLNSFVAMPRPGKGDVKWWTRIASS